MRELEDFAQSRCPSAIEEKERKTPLDKNCSAEEKIPWLMEAITSVIAPELSYLNNSAGFGEYVNQIADEHIERFFAKEAGDSVQSRVINDVPVQCVNGIAVIQQQKNNNLGAALATLIVNRVLAMEYEKNNAAFDNLMKVNLSSLLDCQDREQNLPELAKKAGLVKVDTKFFGNSAEEFKVPLIEALERDGHAIVTIMFPLRRYFYLVVNEVREAEGIADVIIPFHGMRAEIQLSALLSGINTLGFLEMLQFRELAKRS